MKKIIWCKKEKNMDKEKEEARRLEIESNLQKLTERRNSLKDAGQLVDDVATLLNRGIIINMLDLANIKNEGVVLNLLRIYNDTMNELDSLNYNSKSMTIEGGDIYSSYFEMCSDTDKIQPSFEVNCRGFKNIEDNFSYISKNTRNNINGVQMSISTGVTPAGFGERECENIQTYFFNNNNLLVQAGCNYGLSKNDSILIDPLRVQEDIFYNNDFYEVVNTLYYGQNGQFYDDYPLHTTKPEAIQTKSESLRYANAFERVLPKNLIMTNRMDYFKFIKNLENVSPELFNKIGLLETNEEEKSGPRL